MQARMAMLHAAEMQKRAFEGTLEGYPSISITVAQVAADRAWKAIIGAREVELNSDPQMALRSLQGWLNVTR
jgi:hypothetical protein